MNNKTEKSKTEKRTTTRPLVYVAVIICFVTGKCGGKLIKRPVNVTVFEGERTILECVTDFHDLQHTVFWKFENDDIFYGGEISLLYASKFRIQKDHTKGIYNLIIPNATKSLNGRYTCADNEGEGEKSDAWVTVAESPTTEANHNSGASTGTDTKTIILAIFGSIAVTLVAVVIIAVVIYICKRGNRSSSNNDGQRGNGEHGVQMQGNANTTSAPERYSEGVVTTPNPKPAKIREDMERRIKNQTAENSKQNKKPGENKKSIDSEGNAAAAISTENDPLTSDLPQGNAESNSRPTAGDAVLESGPLEHSSSQIQTNGEDINDKEEAPSDDKNDEKVPLVPVNIPVISNKDDSSGTKIHN